VVLHAVTIPEGYTMAQIAMPWQHQSRARRFLRLQG
jgi:hypothetical protein